MRRYQHSYDGGENNDRRSLTMVRSAVDSYELDSRSERHLPREEGYKFIPLQSPVSSFNAVGRDRLHSGTVIIPGLQSGQFEEFLIEDENKGYGRSRLAGRKSAQFEDILYDGNRRSMLVHGPILSDTRSMIFPMETDNAMLQRRRLSSREIDMKHSLKVYSDEEVSMIKERLERFVDKVANDIPKKEKMVSSGPCTYCKTFTNKYCKRCEAWYCSRNCQASDWATHKLNCVSVPELGCKGDSTLSLCKDDEHSQHKLTFHNVSHKPCSNFSDHTLNISSRENVSHKTSEELCYENRKHLQNKPDQYNVSYKQNNSFVGNRHGSHKFKEDIDKTHGANTKEYRERSTSSYHKNSVVNQRYKRPMRYGNKEGGDEDRDNGGYKNMNGQGMRNTNELEGSDTLCKSSRPAAVKNGQTQESEVSTTKDVTVQNELKVVHKEETSQTVEGFSLPTDHFKTVKVIVPIKPDQYWVQIVESSEKVLDIMSILNNGSEFSSLQKVEVGTFCTAYYQDELWYRGMVTSTKPELKVLYIDFGNEELCKLDQLRALPDTLKGIPALAIKVKLADGTSKKYESLKEDAEFNVKCVETCDHTSIVHVEGEVYDEITMKPNTSATDEGFKKSSGNNLSPARVENKIDSALAGLKIGSEGGCQFRGALCGDDFSVTIVYSEIRDVFKDLFSSISTETRHSENYQASVGEMVAVESDEHAEGEWKRARVLAVTDKGYRIILCDYCIETTVKVVHKLPELLKSFPEFGGRCTVIENKLEKESYLKLKCKFLVTNMDSVNGVAECTLKGNKEEEYFGKILLRQWVPLSNVLLKDNDRVELTVYFDQRILCLRLVSEDSKRMLSKIENDVHNHCSSSEIVKVMPGKHEIVGCKFLDGIYYRAKILNIDKEEIKVLFIDYGNLAVVKKSALKLLPPALRNLPAQVTRVCLKDVPPNQQMSKKATSLLNNLIDNRVEMKLRLSHSVEEVELILPDGRNLNDLLRNLSGSTKELTETPTKSKELTESPTRTTTTTTTIKPLTEMPKEMKQQSVKLAEENHGEDMKASNGTRAKTDVFTERDMKYLSLPVGKTTELVILYKTNSVSFMACETSEETLQYVHGTMSENMNKYCESTNETYAPRASELCFAKFEDGEWYRGLCIQEGDPSTKEDNIFFIDFGNMAYIDKANMRKMTSEYVKTPALAMYCVLNNPSIEKATEAQKKCVDGLIQINQFYEARIVSCEGLGSYTVELPHVTKELEAKGLL